MMAGYFGSGGPVPDSFKALMPEFQQYWGTSQEGQLNYKFYVLKLFMTVLREFMSLW